MPAAKPKFARPDPLDRGALEDGVSGYLAMANAVLWDAYDGARSTVDSLRIVQASKHAAEIWAARELLRGNRIDYKEIRAIGKS